MLTLTIQNYPTPGEDWWVLRRHPIPPDGPTQQEHERFLRESRLVPQSDLEGTAAEWRQIAGAIFSDCQRSFTRVAIKLHRRGGFLICSPRQLGSMDWVFITSEEAKYLATQIQTVLK